MLESQATIPKHPQTFQPMQERAWSSILRGVSCLKHVSFTGSGGGSGSVKGRQRKDFRKGLGLQLRDLQEFGFACVLGPQLYFRDKVCASVQTPTNLEESRVNCVRSFVV